ncbi:hypothetical protein MUK42_10758 [Musa troglodytarum]|nr:hypothetical protein MUK42_10758 [Musa troglodytarum]
MGRANGVGVEDCDHLVGKDLLPGMVGSGPTKAYPRSASDSSMVAASCDGGTPLSLRPVFELPPSEEETEAAISILNQVFVLGTFVHASEIGPSLDKKAVNNASISSEMTSKLAEKESDLHVEKAMQLSSLKEFFFQGQQKFVNLFNLLQTNPDLQRIVVSLSTDKAIWEAIMKNAAVQDLKESFFSGCKIEAGSIQYDLLNGVGDIATIIVRWILDNIKTKVMGLIDKITHLMVELFHCVGTERSMHILDDVLRSLFMLSLLATIVVVIKRIHSTNAH